jgi:hypothetical protein
MLKYEDIYGNVGTLHREIKNKEAVFMAAS